MTEGSIVAEWLADDDTPLRETLIVLVTLRVHDAVEVTDADGRRDALRDAAAVRDREFDAERDGVTVEDTEGAPSAPRALNKSAK